MQTLCGRRWVQAFSMAAFLMLSGGPPLAAQQTTGSIQGTVRSTEGTPIAGAQVSLEGTRLGGVTNRNGRYQILNVPPGTYAAIAQSIGYATVRREQLAVDAGGTVTGDFEMRTLVLTLSEVVVTGVTEATTRASIPFAVARVGKEEMVVPPKNAIASIQGRVAGAGVIAGEQPGSDVSILLRTPTSINRSTTPLFVVDGVIMTESSADLSTLDIESVEVVKGAAAASLYGSRAASGVVQIRTARGGSLPADQTRFTLRSEYGSSDIPRPIKFAQYHNFQMNAQGEFLDASGQVVPRALAATTQFGIQDQPYPGPTFQHVNSLYNPGDVTTLTGTFGYNSGTTSWLATVSRQHEFGVVRENDGYRRTDFRVNLDHRVRHDLSLSVSAFHMRSTRDELPGGVLFDFVFLAPDVDLLQPDPDGTRYAFQPDDAGIRVNPLYQIVTQDRETRRLRTMASADLSYHPLTWVSFDLNASFDRSDRRGFWWIPKGVKTPDNPTGDPGFVRQDAAVDDGLNASLGMSVSRDFGLLSTRTTLRGIIEREDEDSIRAEGQDLAVGGIPRLDALQVPRIESVDRKIRSSGYFLNTDLNWDDRYIVNALVRRDGSSLFGPEERWHTYYRASAAYRMAQEPWWPFEQLNEFKLRYSRGTAGGRPNFADQFEVFSILSGGGVSLATLGNKALKPEQSTEQEFGVDLVAFERLSLELTHARQTTRDQLVNVPLPSLFGFTSQWQNAGTIQGTTWEGTLTARLLESPRVRWSMTLVADRTRNKIVEYDRPCHTNSTGGADGSGLGWRCAGEQIGNIYTRRHLRSLDDLAEHRGGLHVNSADAFQVNDDGLLVPVGVGNSWTEGVSNSLWGTKVNIDGINYDWGIPFQLLDLNNNPARVRTGDGNPDFRWGLSNQFQWRGFTVYALVDGQMGGDVYNGTKQRMYQWLRHADEDQVGKSEERKKPAVYYTGGLYNGNNAIDWFLEDGTYVKLREVSLRYSVPRDFALLRTLKMDRLVLALIGRNLHTWTGYTGYDPEIGDVTDREDSFDYPRYRTLTASIEIAF